MGILTVVNSRILTSWISDCQKKNPPKNQGILIISSTRQKPAVLSYFGQDRAAVRLSGNWQMPARLSGSHLGHLSFPSGSFGKAA